MAPKRDCLDCAYFEPKAGQFEIGECHRYAPRPRRDSDAVDVYWPVVVSGDWCGEFQPSPRAYEKEKDGKENS